MSLDNTALRLESAPFRISQHLRKDAISIGISTFREEIIKTGLQFGMTQRQLAKLRITPDDDGFTIRLKYHGSVRGDKPKQKWFVAPKNPEGRLSWISATGSRLFSRGHFVTGTDAQWVVDTAVINAMTRFKQSIKSNTERFLEATKIG